MSTERSGVRNKRIEMQILSKKNHFLGHIVSINGVEVGPEKINAVKPMKDP